jgi:hypothetical protein
MSIEDCEAAYAQLSDAIFKPRHSRANVAGRAVDFLKANGKFDEAPLEEVIKDLLQAAGLGADELLEEELEDACKVYKSTKVRIKSYGSALV